MQARRRTSRQRMQGILTALLTLLRPPLRLPRQSWTSKLPIATACLMMTLRASLARCASFCLTNRTLIILSHLIMAGLLSEPFTSMACRQLSGIVKWVLDWGPCVLLQSRLARSGSPTAFRTLVICQRPRKQVSECTLMPLGLSSSRTLQQG